MDIAELKTLEFSQIGSWPIAIRLAIVAALCAVLLYLIWHFDVRGLREQLGRAEDMEVQLKEEFETKQKTAANLNALKEQMKQIQESFGDLLRQLPNKAEMEGLLIDISQTGLSAGLEFKSFRPQNEVLKEFYAELPIEISVEGDYHQFGSFVSGVSSLPRIVTTHNIGIASAGGAGTALRMTIIAKTYRALSVEEGGQQ